MHSLFRGLLAGLLVVGVTAMCAAPNGVIAQGKKEDIKDRLVGVGTSDGLTLNGYWFQGTGIEKQRPDAVIMYPAPGSKINEAWISLAKALSEKNFSVLLFDWRGCGLNAPDAAGPRIFEDKDKFWKEPYNGKLLMSRKTTLEEKGLDWKYLFNASDARGRYRDFMLMNDLLAARFYLDKQSDAGKCNTNRVWLVSEKDGAHVGMGFIAAEFQRNSIFDPKKNIFDQTSGFKPAGKDYAGIMAMSYTGNGPSSGTAHMVYRNALPSVGANENVKEALNHLEDRLAMVMMYTKKEGAGASKSLAASVRVTGAEADMKKKFKYLKEFDIKVNKPISGIDLIDPMDSFGAKDFVVKAMVEISKVQNFNKDPTDREASKMVVVPRFEIEKFNRK